MAESIKLIACGIAKGLQDAVLGIRRIYHLDLEIKKREQSTPKKVQTQSTLARRRAERMQSEDVTESSNKTTPSVLNRLLLCCAWNGGVFMASIMAFNHLIMPFLRAFTELIFHSLGSGTSVWSWLGPTLSWTFSGLWTLPLFLLSKIVNGLWFQDIADSAYRTTRGRPQMLPFSKIIADLLFSLVLQSLFLIQSMLASFLPIRGIGDMVGVLHMCLLYSLYAFEYKWFNMGWEVHKRLSYIEIHWPYFVGFGLPLAVLTALPSSYIMSGCVFSLLFPLFIISANEAEKIQQSYTSFPLQLFAPTIAISNSIFQSSVNRGGSAQPQTQNKDQNPNY